MEVKTIKFTEDITKVVKVGEKEVESEMFIADDGTMFYKWQECRAYEERLKAKEIKSHKLELCEDCINPECCRLRWYYITSEEEFNFLARYYGYNIEYSEKYKLNDWYMLDTPKLFSSARYIFTSKTELLKQLNNSIAELAELGD